MGDELNANYTEIMSQMPIHLFAVSTAKPEVIWAASFTTVKFSHIPVSYWRLFLITDWSQSDYSVIYTKDGEVNFK